MKICSNCGQMTENDNQAFCENCGHMFTDDSYEESIKNYENSGSQDDSSYDAPFLSETERKSLFWAYWGILMLIPILKVQNKNGYYKFHINQGLNALIWCLAANAVSNLLPHIFSLFAGIFTILVLVWAIQSMLDNKHSIAKPRGLLSVFKIIK